MARALSTTPPALGVAALASDQLLTDVLVTAIEGGIGYWSFCEEYHWDTEKDPTLPFAVITETEDGHDDPGPQTYRLDLETIRAGIARVISGDWTFGGPSSLTAKQVLRRKAAHSAKWARWVTAEDEADCDADDADFIVQVALFGEQVYG